MSPCMEELQLKINSRLKDYARRRRCAFFQIFIQKYFQEWGFTFKTA